MAVEERQEGWKDSLATLAAMLSPLALAKIAPFGWGRLTPLMRSSIAALRKSPMEPYVRWLEEHPDTVAVTPWRKKSPYIGQYVPMSRLGPRIELNPIDAIAEALAKKPTSLGHELGHAYLDMAQERIPPGMWDLFSSFEPELAKRMTRSYSRPERNEEAMARFLDLSTGWPYMPSSPEMRVASRLTRHLVP